MSKFLITGGSGFLGINLIRLLLSKGHMVRSLDIKVFDYPENERVEHVLGDIRNKNDVDKNMKDIDIVVHCAAALPLYKKAEIFSIDVDGTKNVLESALQHCVKRVIHISSTAVYGIPKYNPSLEKDELQKIGPYGKAKIDAEKVCEEFRDKGIIVPILRPKSFIGPERLGVFALFFDWASTGHGFPMIGNGKNSYQLLDVYDLCEAINLCATLPPQKVNDTFNIGAEEFTTMKEDYQAVLDYAGFGKKIHGFPAAPMILALRFLEVLRLSPIYKWVYETAAKDSFVSIEKAKNVMGFKPRYSNKDALIRNFQWYLDNKNSFAQTSGISHRVPWKQGVLRFIKLFF